MDRNESTINDLFVKSVCYVCVFLCESVAIIKVSFSIRPAVFQAGGGADTLNL